MSDERGGTVQMDIIENGGRQYKSRTTYRVSCWGKCVRMSAAGSRQNEKKKKNAGRGGPGWMCPITAFELRFLALSEPPFARPPRSHATAKRRRCIPFFLLRLRSYVPLYPYCTTIYSTMPDTFFMMLFHPLIEALET